MINQILLGDCLVKLKELEDNSIDSIVTDPPYEISFMNKKFDSTGIAHNVDMWKECLRVLKPGGHLVSFSATRTYHRMTVAIEDAGFEVRDMITWNYGCLSEDSEIYTNNGWKRYDTIKPTDQVLQFDKYSKEYCFTKIEELFEYRISDTCYRIQSNHTDQLVSRNHRCLVERNGELLFCFAEEAQKQESVPYLENLPSVSETISLHENIPSETGNEMLRKNMSEKNAIRNEKGSKAPIIMSRNCRNILLRLWKNFQKKQKEILQIQSKATDMFSKMQWKKSSEEIKRIQQKEPYSLFGGKTKKNKSTNIRSQKSFLERWYNLYKKGWKLQRRDNVEMSERIHSNGQTERLCMSTSVSYCSTFKKMFNKRGSCSSYRSRSPQQQVGKSNVIQKQQRTQNIRREEQEKYKTCLATITPIKYDGIVWCVKVKSGIFVARRNNKIFITGNSGFPKNRNISEELKKKHNKDIPGLGTHLKPALEPIVLARKSITEDTIADNVVKYNTGALNIDDSRLTEDRWPTNFLHDEYSASVLDLHNENVSRFFYVAKPSKQERELGLDSFEVTTVDDGRKKSIDNAYQRGETERKNIHPTVKPVKLMKYLIKLITPTNGIVLDPFCGSGTTLMAAKALEYNYIGIELDENYLKLATARIAAINKENNLSKFYVE